MLENLKTKIYYYTFSRKKNPIKEFLDSLEETQQVKILRLFEYIEEYGLQAVAPHLKKVVGTLLWEMRILGKDNIRIFYVVPEKNAVLVLHGFIKKEQKTPRREIDLALQRYDWWKRGLTG
ncbi:MAG: type II toxin-antitoxin system RelE/ParE family toxin [Candidatus Wildermuthbacteria bacterium]|nr:type II toxin-antitoxin system RelE/ParE family toxin [Candidatus Wildermuthbacteria bacterium]